MKDADKFIDAVKEGRVSGLSADPYNPALAYDPMDLETKPAERVRFIGHGGYEWQQQEARKHLKVGETYTVESMDVGDWSSSVSLAEYPGKQFNSVMFENV